MKTENHGLWAALTSSGSESEIPSVSGKTEQAENTSYWIDYDAVRASAIAACHKNYNPTLCGGESLSESLVREARDISSAAVAASHDACVTAKGDIGAARTAVSELCSALSGTSLTAYMFGIDAFFLAASTQRGIH